jgi:hypothetical protein
MRYRSGRSRKMFLPVLGMVLALSAPAAAATDQISGVAFYDPGGVCAPAPTGYADIPPVVMTGSLQGCWYTDIVTVHDNGSPSGVYQERGKEIFVAIVNNVPVGTFATTYKFSSKWDPNVSAGVEIHGRCEHPIVADSGTGVFAGVTGRVDFKDEVATGRFLYRGHLSFR